MFFTNFYSAILTNVFVPTNGKEQMWNSLVEWTWKPWTHSLSTHFFDRDMQNRFPFLLQKKRYLSCLVRLWSKLYNFHDLCHFTITIRWITSIAKVVFTYVFFKRDFQKWWWLLRNTTRAINTHPTSKVWNTLSLSVILLKMKLSYVASVLFFINSVHGFSMQMSSGSEQFW